MGQTTIGWTDFSVNPIRARLGTAVGHYCEKVSPGCQNCYASRMQSRFKMPPFAEQRRLDVEHFFDESKLHEVLRRRKPTKWFWCDMSDMFGAWVPNAWIDLCFAVMALTPHHIHQVLTKRPERMLNYFSTEDADGLDARTRIGLASLGVYLDNMPASEKWNTANANMSGDPGREGALLTWPLPNVWLGTSTENQAEADKRIPLLLQTIAAVRYISAEPLLGHIQFGAVPSPWLGHHAHQWLDWVITGGESGPRARSNDIEWTRSIVTQCKAGGVKVFVKQLGAAATWNGCGLMANNPRCRTTKEIIGGREVFLLHPTDIKGSDPAEWPEDLRVQEFPV